MNPRKVTAKQIALAYPENRLLQRYIRGKLVFDPLFDTALGLLKQRGSHIIDLGCGLGLLPLWLRMHGCLSSYAGCEIDHKKIEAARRAASRLGYENIRFHKCDLLEFSMKGAGTVCAFDVLHYLPKEAQTLMVSRLAEAAREGALVLIRTGVSGSGWRSLVTALQECWIRASGWIKIGNGKLPRLNELTARFESLGCTVVAHPLHGKTPFSSYWLQVSLRR